MRPASEGRRRVTAVVALALFLDHRAAIGTWPGRPPGAGRLPAAGRRGAADVGRQPGTLAGRLLLGEEARRTSSILDVVVKTGRSGRLVFVTVRHEISGSAGLAIVDEHDIVYREDVGAGTPARAGSLPRLAPRTAGRYKRIPPCCFATRRSPSTATAFTTTETMRCASRAIPDWSCMGHCWRR